MDLFYLDIHKHYQHYIAGKQGSAFAIFMMYRLHTPAQGSFVHDVVVNKRKIVKQFNSRSYMPGIGSYIASNNSFPIRHNTGRMRLPPMFKKYRPGSYKDAGCDGK